MKRLALAVAAALVLLSLAFALLLGALDRALLDGPFARLLSARFHRQIRFESLQANLLSFDPTLTVRGLVIDNPAALGGGHLAEVRWLHLSFYRAALWHGSFRLRTIAADGVDLHLIRIRPGENNWTFSTSPGSGPAFEPFRGVTRLSISDGHVDIRDHGRKLVIAGPFGQDTTGSLPFHLAGSGTLAGFPVAIALRGGPLHGSAVGQSWPLIARIIDGATRVDAHGTTGDAFSVSIFDLAIAARGPNIADLGYLFHLSAPNSMPYQLRAHGQSDGEHFAFSGMSGVVGHSDVRGWIRSDHSQARKQIRAAVISNVLDRNDVEALLAPVPSRAMARAMPGAVKVTANSRWLLPDAPFGLTRIRSTDFDITVRAGSVANFALPLHNLSTGVRLNQGVLHFDRFASELYGGRLTGAASLDARDDLPRLVVTGRLRHARLIRTAAGNALGANAALNLSFDVHGPGRSVHEAAGRATGTVAMRMSGGVVPRRAGWIMGGDLLRAIGASDRMKNGLPLTCAAIDLSGSGGPFSVRRFKVQTPLGFATGSGIVDFGREEMRILMQGHPSQQRLFQISTPLQIEGPLQKPVLTILPGGHARKLGLKGKFGIVLSPVASLLPLGQDKLPAASTSVSC